MAAREYVEQFVTEFAGRDVESALGEQTKNQVGGLLDWYESSGYTSQDLAKSLQEKVPPSELTEASPEEFTKAVEELAAPPEQAPVEQTPVDQTSTTTQTPTQEPAEAADDEVLAYLAAELAADTTPEIESTKQALFAHVTAQLWEQVRADVEAEMRAAVAAEDAPWENDEQVKAAAYEPAYNAFVAAFDALWTAGNEEGGYAALLSRPQE